MNTPLRLTSAALMLLLAACTPRQAFRQPADTALLQEQARREQATVHLDHWTIEGKLGISDGKDGGSGSLTWEQDGDNYRFEVRTPVTGKSFRLSGGPQGAVLEGLDGGPRHGADAESLMTQAFGWDVPLAELRAWVLGARADEAGPAQLQFGADRLPSLLVQDGWSVDYRRWDTTRQPPLPLTVFAAKPPYKVKLAISSWTLR